MLKRAGGSDELIGELHGWQTEASFTPPERAALALAEHMTLNPAAAVADALWDDLKAHFDDGQIIELTACIGAFNAFNRMANALAVEITR